MTVVEHFLKYISFDTQSNEIFDVTPSTSTQMELALELKVEMQIMGLQEISLDQHAYLMGTLPANTDKPIPTIGFIAHLDTSPDMSGNNVKPHIVSNYNGKDIILNEKENIILSPAIFPELLQYIGEDIIVTDGTTLLGADDKAGIAEIMTAIQYLIDHPEIKHGRIRIAFNPDEEIGRGSLLFDMKKFDCEWAYTVDGGEVGKLEYENFNAANVKVIIKGLHVHPGYAKNKMLNANLIAVQFIGMLPPPERPEYTENYEGFFHLTNINGTIEKTILSYNVRDHNQDKFQKRLKFLQDTADYLNKIYSKDTVQLEIKQQYRNMYDILKSKKHIIALAKNAMEELSITPIICPIRGCTDGSQLSFKGLPCPNIFTGGLNLHGKYEYIPIKSMEKAVKVIVEIIKLNAKEKFIDNTENK